MDSLTYRWLLAGALVGVAILATVCTALITSKRTYYPLLKLIFAITAGTYGANGAALYWQPDANPAVRLITAYASLFLLVLSTVFIARRNALPQWVNVDWKGSVEGDVDAAELDHCVLTTISLVRHGAASPELIGQLRTAIDNWERHKRWTSLELPGQIAARRAARQAQNAANEVAAVELRGKKEEQT